MLRRMPICVILVLAFLLALTAAMDGQARAADAMPKSRTFLFTYRTTVTGLPAGKLARIWVPIPPSNSDQDMQIMTKQLPAEGQIAREPKFGNQILYVQAEAGADGKIPLEVTYRVTRREVKSSQK